VSAALLVAGCSSSGGKQSTPTAGHGTTTTLLAAPRTTFVGAISPPGPEGPTNVATSLGPCPQNYPNTPLTMLNSGVAGLDKKLVPIVATEVEVCSYGRPLQYPLTPPPLTLYGSGRLAAQAAATFENETNRLQRYPRGTTIWRGSCIKYPGPLLVMFANGSQHVDVRSCPAGWCRSAPL
jgi:hypothetical protein